MNAAHRHPFRWQASAVTSGLILLVFAAPIAARAQRVAPARPWTPAAGDWITRITLRPGAQLPPALTSRIDRGMLFEQVTGFRFDSLVLRVPARGSWGAFGPGPVSDTLTPTLTLTLPASAVERVAVRRYSQTAARRGTGGETGFYAGLLGAAVGAGVSALAWKKHIGLAAAIGFAGGFGVGYRSGARKPYHEYGYVWDEFEVRVAPGLPCVQTCGPE